MWAVWGGASASRKRTSLRRLAAGSVLWARAGWRSGWHGRAHSASDRRSAAGGVPLQRPASGRRAAPVRPAERPADAAGLPDRGDELRGAVPELATLRPERDLAADDHGPELREPTPELHRQPQRVVGGLG